MRFLLAFLVVPAIAAAQAAFPTEWPNGAQPLSPEALRQQLVGKTFVAKSLTSPPCANAVSRGVRLHQHRQYQRLGYMENRGSAVCIEWRTLRPACSEIKAVGEALYVKRANNGEIMAMVAE